MSDLPTSLNTVLNSAPEIGQSPGLALSIAQAGGNLQQNAQAVARGANSISDQNAHTQVSQSAGGGNSLTDALNWFGNHVDHAVTSVGSDVVHGAATVGSAAMNTLNKPLQIVQHEYRYLQDVEARHGAGAALLEGLGIAGGAAAGFVGGGLYGAELGGEAAAGAEGQLFFKDSWQRTANGNTYTDPRTHQPVSIGRDVASLLGLSRSSTVFKITSGLVDGIADIGLDPLQAGGGLVGGARSAEGAAGKLGDLFGGTHAATAEDIDRVYAQYGSVRRAFADIAGKSAGEIVATPAYRSIAMQGDLLKALGSAQDADQVAQVFKDVYRVHELAFMDKLPTLSITRLPFQRLREIAEGATEDQNAPVTGLVGRAAQRITRLPDAWDDAAKVFSGHEFDPSSPLDDGTSFIYRTARFTENRRTAASIADAFHNADDLEEKVRIYRNLALSTVFNMAGFRGTGLDEFLNLYQSDPELQAKLAEGLSNAVGGGMFGKEAEYGLDDNGHNLSIVRGPDGWQFAAGITQNQVGKLRGIDLNEARRAAKTLAGAKDLFGRAGDFAYDHVTQGIFKPLVLLTPSYALHISLAELIPNALRLGTRNLVHAAASINAARFGAKELSGDELTAIQGVAYRLARGVARLTGNRMTDEDIQLFARMIESHDGHLIPAGVSSGHDYAGEVANREEKSVSLLRRRLYNAPMKTGDTFGKIGVSEQQHLPAWQAWLKEIANDEPSRIGAQSLINAMKGTRTEEIPFEIPQAEMYHGTPRELPNGELNPDRYGAGASSNLFGPGVYTTDNPEVATSYTGKGSRGAERVGQLNKTVYGMRWNGATPARLVDLETIAPTELRDAFRGALRALDSDYLDVAEDDYAALRSAIEDRTSTGADLYKALSAALAGNSRESADEIYHDITDAVESAGFDGYRYQGGVRAASGSLRHEAKVFFDPSKLAITNSTAVRRTTERATTLDEATGQAARDVSDYLHHTIDPAQRNRMMRSKDGYTSFGLPGTELEGIDRPADWDSIDEWAHIIVHNIRGATRGADKSMNLPLLDHVAKGEWATEDELNAIPTVKRPILVKGRELMPDGSSRVQRIANVGFRRILNPMVNFLSRQPIYAAEFKKQWALLADRVANGTLDEDEAWTLAEQRSVYNVMRNVHNLHDRTQWTVTMRNWAPFYFAQEQAYRRAGRLLASDPGAFRKYQLMISNIHDVGQIMGGQNGQGYFVMPGTGWMTSGLAKALSEVPVLKTYFPIEGSSPIGMGWNLSSSSVIFPLSSGFRPDVGPLVSIPVQAMAQFFPETLSPVLKSDLTAAANTIIGPTASQAIYQQFIPNVFVQRMMGVVFPQFNERSFDSTMMQVLATLEAQNKIPPPTASPWAMQDFINSVRNQTRIMYAMKALVGLVTPVSPEVTNPIYNNMNAALSADINNAKSVSKGIQEFLAKNPDATPFTVFQSTNEQGVSLPASVSAENWINENMGIIRSSGGAALLLMPPNTDTTYNSTVYNEQIAQGLRTKWFPGNIEPNGELAGYLAQLYISAGNAIVLDKWYPQYEAALKGLSGTPKFDAETAWQNTLAKYALANPIWGTWWNADDKETQRGQLLQNMRTLLASPEAPKTDLAQQTRTLISAYDNYQNQLSVGAQDGYAGESQSQINQQWKDNLYATVAAHPEVANVVTGLFLSLPSTQPTPPATESGTPGQFTAQSWRAA